MTFSSISNRICIDLVEYISFAAFWAIVHPAHTSMFPQPPKFHVETNRIISE